jgi:hypothetical protein
MVLAPMAGSGRDADAARPEVERCIVDWLTSVGIDVDRRVIAVPGAVPGVTLGGGGLVVDPSGPAHVGDLLHEAGHLALLPPSVRARAEGRLDDSWGTEMEAGAICWSVAAAWHLGLDLRAILHDHGYRGAGSRLASTFEAGVFPGLPLLIDAGLAHAPRSAPVGAPAYPAMIRWLRAEEANPGTAR